MRTATVCLLSAMVLAMAGCGGSGDGAQVSGVVTHKDAPVPQGTIAFLAEGTPVKGGAIGLDGSYSVTLPPGDYQVRVDARADRPANWKESDPLPPLLVPEKYTNFDTSGLNLTVPDESSVEQNFDLP